MLLLVSSLLQLPKLVLVAAAKKNNIKINKNSTTYLGITIQSFETVTPASFPSFACVKTPLNCKPVTLAESASECSCIHMIILSVFLQPFEHEFISLFLSHTLIVGGGCNSFLHASVFVTEQVSNPTKYKHFPH